MRDICSMRYVSLRRNERRAVLTVQLKSETRICEAMMLSGANQRQITTVVHLPRCQLRCLLLLLPPLGVASASAVSTRPNTQLPTDLWPINPGADLGFYKGGCHIHLKRKPPRPNYFDPCYRNQTVFWPLKI